MILNQLVLHNVGTFAGRHVLDLTPPSETQPVVLVGGLNGAGKTTILESIQLALYGSLIHASGRRTGSYENYLRGLVHRGVALSEGAAIELTFTAHQEGVEHTYWIRRSWKSTGSSIREILLVSVDGRHNQSLTATWNEHVETFLPRGIAGLFFFDGEQIEALADMERSRQVLGSALAALLGLDLVDRLTTDLSVLRRRHRGEQVPEELRQAIEEKKQLVTAHRQAEEAATEAEAARRTEVERCEKLLHEATEAYRAAGGDLLEQHEAAESTATMVRAGLARCEDEVRHELGESTPLLQVEGLLSQLAEQARAEDTARRDALVVDAFSSRDELLLQQLRDAKVKVSAIQSIEQFLTTDREQRRSSVASTEDITGLTDLPSLEGFLATTVPEARKRLESALERRASACWRLSPIPKRWRRCARLGMTLVMRCCARRLHWRWPPTCCRRHERTGRRPTLPTKQPSTRPLRPTWRPTTTVAWSSTSRRCGERWSACALRRRSVTSTGSPSSSSRPLVRFFARSS